MHASETAWTIQLRGKRPVTTSGWLSFFFMVACLGCHSMQAGPQASESAILVVPTGTATEPGAGSILRPFHEDNRRELSVYPASQFLAAMPEGAIIQEIAFRLDEGTASSVTAIVPDLEVRMSTSAYLLPDTPQFFSTFVGADETVVFGRRPLSFSARAGSNVNPFDIRIILTTPFLYDPRQGNLSLDTRTFLGTSPFSVVGVDAAEHGGARTMTGDIRNDQGRSLGVTAPVLQLRFTAIPEPPLAGILLLGWAFLLQIKRRMR